MVETSDNKTLLNLKLPRVDVVKRVKIWKVLLLENFLLVGFLTKLCLYISQIPV